MKIQNIEKLMSALSIFAENYKMYNISKFDASVQIFLDLSYSIELDFINFYCEVSKGNFAKMKTISITPDEQVGIENWIWLYYEKENEITHKDLLYSTIIKQPFVKWIIENKELFDSTTKSSELSRNN